MAKKKLADLLTEVLADAGVQRIYGVPGDSLNGITDSIRARKDIQWVHLRHEETAAFAAGAEAYLTGTFEEAVLAQAWFRQFHQSPYERRAWSDSCVRL